MKKAAFVLLILGAVTGGFYFYRVRTAAPEPVVTTQPFSRGDIVDAVSATGTLEAVETVEVGTQVSGVVRELNADFNSIVRKGQVIARLDPQLIQTQIEQQSANVLRAEADVERLKVSLADAEQKRERAEQLNARNLIPRTELETAEVNVASAKAQVRSSEASLTQARAQLRNQRVNLGYTTITAPIDGIVISRNVDAGQTVAASMNAPTLFVLAADLTRMQVVANVDESDVGRMRPGQFVSFQVDAYPNERFTGTVSQVRLQPTVVQNVVTYSTVITVPNLALKLKPGMTANVNIEILRRNHVLRVANAATRFRPTAEMFSVLNQPAPPELQRTGTGARGGRARTDGNPSPLQPQRNGSTAQPAVGASTAQPAVAASTTPVRTAASKATTIDALFAPLTTNESRGVVWLYDGNKQLKAVRLRLGATDGTFTEVLNEADLATDAQIVTAMKTGLEQSTRTATTTQTGNPLMGGGPPGGRGGPGGGRGF
jgi:HlyD family secretion protein